MTVAEQIRAEEELAQTLKEYSGQWVATRGHHVVADAPTLEDLLVEVEGLEVEVFHVPEDTGAACFF